jgi:hypothetical protein
VWCIEKKKKIQLSMYIFRHRVVLCVALSWSYLSFPHTILFFRSDLLSMQKNLEIQVSVQERGDHYEFIFVPLVF